MSLQRPALAVLCTGDAASFRTALLMASTWLVVKIQQGSLHRYGGYLERRGDNFEVTTPDPPSGVGAGLTVS